MMFPGTLNSSTLQASTRSLFVGGNVFLRWKIRQSTDGTGMGFFGLGLALKPKDFKSKLSCKLSSIPRTRLRRAQARVALKLGRSPMALLSCPRQRAAGLGTQGQ
ncbi:hypothetical protein N303_15327, partial [Cuculus canorus]